jgi:hypothetical protein
MRKPLPDGSQPEETYEVPANVWDLVQEIELRARKTYPDHGESQKAMVRQELIAALSNSLEAEEQVKTILADLAELSADAANKMLELHGALTGKEKHHQPRKGWVSGLRKLFP